MRKQAEETLQRRRKLLGDASSYLHAHRRKVLHSRKEKYRQLEDEDKLEKSLILQKEWPQ